MSNILKTIVASSAITLAAASLASAATYNFNTAGPDVASLDVANFTITPGASGFLNYNALISQNTYGLGVVGSPDSQGNEIDGTPKGSAEFLTVVFDWAVNLTGITLGRVEGNIFGIGGDQFDISLDGGAFQTFNAWTLPGGFFAIGQDVTSFTLRASGSYIGDLDDFTLKGFEVSPVPLPAAGFLLMAGLAGLSAASRRRRHTA